MTHNPFEPKYVEKVVAAAEAVENFIIDVAESRKIEVPELGMAVVAMLVNRIGKANGRDAAMQIAEALTTVASSMEDAE